MSVEYFFFPLIVVVVLFLAILSARLLFRLMLAFVSVLLIWFGLFLLGVLPSPVNFFKTSLQQNERRSSSSIEPLVPSDTPEMLWKFFHSIS